MSYLNQGELQKKLLRNTLKTIQIDIPILLKVHRSHLINPSHFKAWKGTSSIILTQMEIPVSKKLQSRSFRPKSVVPKKPIRHPKANDHDDFFMFIFYFWLKSILNNSS